MQPRNPNNCHARDFEVALEDMIGSGPKETKVDIPVTPSPHPSVTVSRTNFMLIMVAIWIGNFAAFFNKFSATTSQHVVARDFNDLANQNWMATAYLLGFTTTQTLLERFSDIFGRVAMFNSTLLIFMAGTVWCGLAESMNSFIGGRLVQGIGAAGCHIIGIIVIVDLTTPDDRGLWLGFFDLSLTMGMVAGPILGAVLSVEISWRWQFWLTLILIGVTYICSAASMQYPVPHKKQNVNIISQLAEIDYVGCLFAVGISSFICIAVEMGNKTFPWNSPQILGLLVLGALLIPIFVLYELKVSQPVIDIRLFTVRNVPIACLINFLAGAASLGAIFVLPRYFININNSSLKRTGVEMLAITLSSGLSSIVGANLISKTGQVRLIGFCGGTLFAIGAALMLLVERPTPPANVIGFSILLGIGSGILLQLALIIGPMSVMPHQISGISAFSSYLRTVGGTFGVVLLTSIFETGFTSALHGKIPRNLVIQGLRLADQHALYPEFNDRILDALVKGYHFANVPSIIFGVLCAFAMVMLRNIDFEPAWKRKQTEMEMAREESWFA